MHSVPAKLYDEDFYAWTQDQARALAELAATRPNAPVDFPNLIEEVEDLGRSARNAVRSQMRRLLEHLLKLAYSPATEPRRGWLATVDQARLELRDHLTPTLRQDAEAELPRLYLDARLLTIRRLANFDEDEAAARLPTTCPFPVDRPLDPDWYPPPPAG